MKSVEKSEGKSKIIEYTFTKEDIGTHTLSFPQLETLRNIEYDKCNIRKVKHVRKDGSEEDGYVLYFFKDGVIKLDIFSKDVKLYN